MAISSENQIAVFDEKFSSDQTFFGIIWLLKDENRFENAQLMPTWAMD